MTKTKEYDRAYFDRWYRNRTTRVNEHAEVRRKAALAIATTEYFLHRKIVNVLDVGCGEGAWRAHLRSFRPRIEYLGLDSSEYAVSRYGRSRNIRRATFGELPSLDLGTFDLVVCSDVLHYVADDELRAGAGAIARLCDGIAFIEVLTSEDDVVGDLDAFIHRPAAWYRTVFRKAGLERVAPYCWLSPALRDARAELE
ncbi:MAG TPA: class I SAM-dependent methyltransferase [Thermoanaerobaculia bacterium]|nr:class I SAM-dependent methyltransferase [Thermoanaerobaculia bacterium]